MSEEIKVEDVVCRVIAEEAKAVEELKLLSGVIAEAVQLISASNSPLIISGVGKSGHIASKIASTFRSLGKPAIFVHAAEASHGDLGLVQNGSIVVVLSNSGETTELSDLLSFCKNQGNKLIAITGQAKSTLASISDIAIVYDIEREACRHGLAPTTSTTVALVIGDAIAIGYSELANRTSEDFRRYHPGGNLSLRLKTARNLMKPIGECPILNLNADTEELLLTMSEGKMGFCVLMEKGEVFGVITDGDLRRNISKLKDITPKDIATHNPISIDAEMVGENILKFLNEKRVSQALVYDKSEFIGIVHVLALSGKS